LIIVDECHRSINIGRKLIFDHFLCPALDLLNTENSSRQRGKNISEEDLAILDTYKLFGCETGEPDYQFDLARGIEEGFFSTIFRFINRENSQKLPKIGVEFDHYMILKRRK